MPSLNLRLLPLMASLAFSLTLAACGGGDDAAPATGGGGTAPPAAFDAPTLTYTDPQSTYDLANYTLTGRYSLPVGSGANLLAEEASGVTFNKDTGTLFVVGDGGTSVTQVTKQGVLIDSMQLAADLSKPQGTYFYDTEGIAYIGGGKFVMVEERDRIVDEFTYAAGTTLGAAGVRAVKLGTTIGNTGIEGITWDPMTAGFVAVKESGPQGVFQTTINFAAGTASNGSPTTENPTNLFDPARTGLSAINDVFALSNIVPATAPDYSHLMILSAPAGKIVKMNRGGDILGTLDVGIAAQNEGMAMDDKGVIYVVSEIGGGAGHPEMLVYAPSTSKDAVGTGSNLYVNFATNVAAGAGNIILSNGSTDVRSIPVTDTAQVSFKGKTIVVNPAANLLPGTSYSITFAAGLVKDASGNASPAVSSTTALAFKTAGNTDTTAPTMTATSPLDNATGITSSHIVLTFNEAVKAGTGTIVITNGAGDTRTIGVTDATQVTFSGNTVDINPAADLLGGSNYNVQLAAGVITDTSGNAFAGITSATALDFATASAPPTVLSAGDLLFIAANSDATDAFAFVLTKAVTAGTEIGFSDRNYSAATGMPATGEAAYIWTANVAYPAGTIITIQTDLTTPIADKGTIQGAGGGLSTSAETVYAFQGTISGLTASTAGSVTVARFIAAVQIGAAAGDIPAELTTAGAFISFPLDNAKYNGSMDRSNLATFVALVKNFGNWVTDDTTSYPLTSNSLFPGL